MLARETPNISGRIRQGSGLTCAVPRRGRPPVRAQGAPNFFRVRNDLSSAGRCSALTRATSQAPRQNVLDVNADAARLSEQGCSWRKTDLDGKLKVSEGPQADSCTAARPCARLHSYSITSSARASSVGGTVRPSAFAVLRLMTISNFVGACTGRSAGFSPLRILST